tara:strand:- start:914 stop:1444 length:531 start_codon:yes stop_codon:yes gene_type:complete
MMKYRIRDNIRELIFGFQDGAIGNLGVVIGMAQALSPNNIILLAGVSTMMAQTISMSSGNYISIISEKEYFSVDKKDRNYGKAYAKNKSAIFSSIIMGISVMVGALLPMLAFFYYSGVNGILPSIAITTLGLFIAGVIKSKYTNLSAFRSGMEILIVAVLAASAGYLIGDLFSGFF